MFKNLSFFSLEAIEFMVSFSIFEMLNGNKKTNSFGLLEIDLLSVINGLFSSGLLTEELFNFTPDLFGIAKFCPIFNPSIRRVTFAFCNSSIEIEYNFEIL